jgi:GxxExxY protein
MTKLIYPELSYLLVGAMFSVYNRMGFGYHEKYYQRAFAKELQFLKLKYKKEGLVKISYRETIIGRYFVDFLVENKIVVEIKVAKEFYPTHLKQILA